MFPIVQKVRIRPATAIFIGNLADDCANVTSEFGQSFHLSKHFQNILYIVKFIFFNNINFGEKNILSPTWPSIYDWDSFFVSPISYFWHLESQIRNKYVIFINYELTWIYV